jgi:hypothetical protein
VKSHYKLQQESGIIESLEVREWIQFRQNLISEITQEIQQSQKLTLKGTSKFHQMLSYKHFFIQ